MIPNPIGKVLSTIRKHRVRALLMGGQACILYGAAEFSRDVDFAVLADAKNLSNLSSALAELRAESVYVPPLGQQVLLRGHACHFRAHVPEAEGLRIDVMSVLRGCDTFDILWSRRRRIVLPSAGTVNVLALADLVQAKKTQQDKDWPMIRRLVEVDYHQRSRRPGRQQVEFWLREARTAALLMELSRSYPAPARKTAFLRPALHEALGGDTQRVEQALREEEDVIRDTDRTYWQPLREELVQWRQNRSQEKGSMRDQ